MAGRVAKLLVGLVLGIASVAAADGRPVTIAILDFELIDDTGDTAARAAQETRLRMISDQLRREFSGRGLYAALDNAPAAGMIATATARHNLHACNGCELDIGAALGADRVLTGWVQKVSNLILNINIEIKSVVTGKIVLKKSVDIRGNTDASWSRDVSHMLHDMAEEKQGGR